MIEKKEEKRTQKNKSSIELNDFPKLKQRKGRYGYNVMLNGRIIKKSEYWNLRILHELKVNKKKKIPIQLILNEKESIRMLQIMKLLNATSPSDLFKQLVNQEYAKIRIDTFNERIKKKKGKKS